MSIRIRIGEGEVTVAYTHTSVILIDSLTNTRILIFYNPYVRRWYAMLTDPQGNFIKSLRYISLCAVAVTEYCARSIETGNLYIDALYCTAIDINEINAYWQPAEYIIRNYMMGIRREYYRWRRAVVEALAKEIAESIRTGLMDAELTVTNAIRMLFGNVNIDQIGYAVTGYKYCPYLLYGIYCRMIPVVCQPTRCKCLCNVARHVLPELCNKSFESECILNKYVYKPISTCEHGWV